jgi:flagellar motor switch protein FliG
MSPSLAPSPAASAEDGLTRSARLLVALGPAAEDVLARFSGAEAQALRTEMARLSAARGDADRDVWDRFDALPAETLAALLESEPPMVRAVLASRLSEEKGAELIAVLPDEDATELILRLVRQGPVPASVEELVSRALEARLDGITAAAGGLKQAGALVSRLPDSRAERILSGMGARDPDTAERLRRERLTMEDLARLDAEGLQVLLAEADRDMLATALKSAPSALTTVIRAGLTERARRDLDTRAAAMPGDRGAIEDAQAGLLRLAHSLVRQGRITRPAPIQHQ